MWFGTDHTVTQNNYNLLWALPTHVVAAFLMSRKSKEIKTYFKATFILTILLAITWFLLPQQMNSALLPLVLIILFRSWHLSKPNTYAAQRASL
jgi:hypothetical protein